MGDPLKPWVKYRKCWNRILSIREMKIGSIVIACYEFDKMWVFCQEALYYIPREPAKDG